MRLLNLCLVFVALLLLIVFLFRVYIVVLLLMHEQFVPTFTIFDKAMTGVAILAMLLFFSRSIVFDNATEGCREATNLTVMRNASFIAMVACLVRLVTTCFKLMYETAISDITVVYVICECLLWLALSIYFFVYFKDKYMKLETQFTMEVFWDWVYRLLPGNRKVSYLEKWAKKTTVDGCGKVTVERNFRCNDIYVDLRWWLSPKEGEDPSLKTDYYKRTAWDSLYENIDVVEKRIIEEHKNK